MEWHSGIHAGKVPVPLRHLQTTSSPNGMLISPFPEATSASDVFFFFSSPFLQVCEVVM